MPTNLNKMKSSAAFSLVLFLTACGGGSGGGARELLHGTLEIGNSLEEAMGELCDVPILLVNTGATLI